MDTTPPDAFSFRTQVFSMVPSWLATGNGQSFLYTLELCRDLLCEKAYQAAIIRLPGVGDPSNLPYLSYDRQLFQGPAESNASFAARLADAFQTWDIAGSASAVIEQLQAYMQGLQPGVAPALPAITIVQSYGAANITAWNQVYQDTPVGAPVTLTQVTPENFNWDGDSTKPWRAWLILPMALVPTGQSGSGAITSTASASQCFAEPGQNVGGVWVPATSGTPINSPWITMAGFTTVVGSNVGDWITVSGSSNPGNNGTFQIISVQLFTHPHFHQTIVITNPNGVAGDAGPLTWSISSYPWIGPGFAWGVSGQVFGEGELVAPPIDTGSDVGGVWQPTTAATGSTAPSFGWGISVAAGVVESIRSIVATWKSAGTYYSKIIVAFDCVAGSAGSAYSPNSTPGSGNPDGSFGHIGKNVGGVWVPARMISSPYDAYCQGTGFAQDCSVENYT